MILPIGFAWLAYQAIHNHTENLLGFSYTYDFSDSLGIIQGYLQDSNNLLTYLKNIGSGIGQIFVTLPPLIIYFFLVAIIITILGLMIRIIVDIL